MTALLKEKVEKEIGFKLTNLQWTEAISKVKPNLEKNPNMTEDQKYLLYCIKCMDVLGI